MDILDLFHETYAALVSNKIRTVLSVLGIVIGITSVIVIMALGEGAKQKIEDSFGGAGATMMQISAGAPYNPERGVVVSNKSEDTRPLSMKDLEALKDIPNVKYLNPEIDTYNQITSPLGNNTGARIIGAREDYLDIYHRELYSGSMINDDQIVEGKRVAILGARLAKTLFKGEQALGDKVRIGTEEFSVIGVLAPKGDTMGGQDDVCLIPFTTVQRLYIGNDTLNSITIVAADKDHVVSAKNTAMDRLRAFRHKDEGEEDFNINTQEEMLKEVNKAIAQFTLFLGAIAGISLLVGGIGIMNMMLTTVTERTREIGLRKAIGARRKDIVLQFIIEAIILTLVGGVIGALLGWGISAIISAFAPIKAVVSLFAIMLSFGVCTFIGIVFGYYPARRAAKLKPIEALRYE